MWATHLSGQEHQPSPPSLPPSINPTPTLFQKELQAAAWQWITLKPDLSYHIYRRYYHLTIVRNVRDPNVTHQAPFSRHVQCLVLSHISSLKILCKPSSTIHYSVRVTVNSWFVLMTISSSRRYRKHRGATGPNSKQQRIREKVTVSWRSFLYS